MNLTLRPSDRADGGVDARVAARPSDKEVSCFIGLGDE